MISQKCPELRPGIRIQYYDRDSKLRAEYILDRQGNVLTVINVLKEKTRIGIEKVRGYWNPDADATVRNLIQIRNP